jgi:hypothetical protein
MPHASSTVFIVPPRKKAFFERGVSPYTRMNALSVTWLVPSPPFSPRISTPPSWCRRWAER